MTASATTGVQPARSGSPEFVQTLLAAGDGARDGITVVMPAYREEENLAATVADFLQMPESLGIPHSVVVVNDGSTDRTGEIAEQLAAQNPGRVVAVHHEVNRGYGAAVSTGIAAALALDHRWIFLTDSDGQFKATQVPAFLNTARRELADAVVGYRPRRADPLYRKVNAFLWTTASRILLPVKIRDVDCSYKLIDRRCFRGFALTGDAATISPELIARLRLQDARIIERPVDHFPREHGEQTGAKLSVIIRSLIGLLALSAEIASEGMPGHFLRRLLQPKETVLAVTTLAAVSASVTSYLYFLHQHATLAYPDAISHLLIARRLIDSPTAGVAQLGAVWLPLPHLLSLPFIWLNPWYYSGFAGSLVSMAAYVLTVRYAYLISAGITGSRAGGVVAAVTFGANPNVLYLQSTPMTELLLIACIAATVYYLMRWCQTGSYIHLAATAVSALLATLTRYEGWVLCLAVMLIVVVVAWRRPAAARGGSHLAGPRAAVPARWSWWSRLVAVEANAIFYGCLAMSGIAGWILWNAVIFHDAFYFQTGPFAKPSLWISHSDTAIGHWGLSALTYLYAMADNAGAAAFVLGAAGFVYYLARTLLHRDAVAPLALTAFVPFFVYALYSGQRPLHVIQLNGSLYNIRFGLLMVLPTAIFTGYLVTLARDSSRSWLRAAGCTALVLAALACAELVYRGGIDTLNEAVNFRSTPAEHSNTTAANWLRAHYSGGKMLMESFGNETVTFSSRIPLGLVVYEGSFRLWGADLADPAAHGIRWIYMRRTPGSTDDVFRRLHGTAALTDYRLVYQDPQRLIYERRGWPLRATAGTGQGTPGLAGAAAARGQAVKWIARSVGDNAVVACDPAICSALRAAGLAGTSLLVLQPSATDPLGADIIVATPAIRNQFGARLGGVYAPAVLASFGTGAVRIDIRAVAPEGAAAYRAALAADVAARKAFWAQLLSKSKIGVAPAARAQLADGMVDLRILAMLRALAQAHPVRILGFGGLGPSSSPGLPLPTARLSAADPQAGMTHRNYLSWLLGFLRSHRVPYRAAHITVTRGRVPAVVIRFGLPNPLGLLGAPLK